MAERISRTARAARQAPERPVIFSGPMVRAILDGRKTQTRRLVNPQPTISVDGHWCKPGRSGKTTAQYRKIIQGPPHQERMEYLEPPELIYELWDCPYQVGMKLWVRETWKPTGMLADARPSLTKACRRFAYKTDPEQLKRDWSIPWRSPIHMPRWASRITLEVTGVRVERLTSISRMDCVREGWPHDNDPAHHLLQISQVEAGLDDENIDDAAICWFADTWESLHGAGSFETSPWVWVVEFS